jgi:lipoate-protein ligase A
MRGLAGTGITSHPHAFSIDLQEVKRETKLPCFLAPNRSEIMVEGKKLIGSAQKRTSAAVLQHGSIPLTAGFRELPRYQKLGEQQRAVFTKLLQVKCTCIAECVASYTTGALVDALIGGFATVLPFPAGVKPWTEEERTAISGSAAGAAFRNAWL